MNHSRLMLLFATAFMLNFSARAEDFTFKNLTDADFEKVTQDLSATFAHTSVSGASPLGDIWGFEIGVVGGQINTPEVDKLVKRGDPSASADKLPGAEILGVVSVPFAITGPRSLSRTRSRRSRWSRPPREPAFPRCGSFTRVTPASISSGCSRLMYASESLRPSRSRPA